MRLEGFPDGCQPRRQRRQLSEIDIALTRSVKIRAAGREEIVLARQTAEKRHVGHGMTARHDLNRLSAEALEFIEEGVQIRPRKLVAARMRNRRDAAGTEYPAERLSKRYPLVIDVAGAPRHDVGLENAAHVLAHADLD